MALGSFFLNFKGDGANELRGLKAGWLGSEVLKICAMNRGSGARKGQPKREFREVAQLPNSSLEKKSFEA